jgi:hypothetical protein
VTIVTPSFLGSRKQLTTEESNDDRKLTAFRWKVEAANSSIKNWSLLNCLTNIEFEHLMDYVKLASALTNLNIIFTNDLKH